MQPRAVPDGLRELLRASFAAEIAERLPHLESDPRVVDPELVRRDAHTLASSAVVVGEPAISELARAVELDVEGGPRAELVTLLRAWAP